MIILAKKSIKEVESDIVKKNRHKSSNTLKLLLLENLFLLLIKYQVFLSVFFLLSFRSFLSLIKQMYKATNNRFFFLFPYQV